MLLQKIQHFVLSTLAALHAGWNMISTSIWGQIFSNDISHQRSLARVLRNTCQPHVLSNMTLRDERCAQVPTAARRTWSCSSRLRARFVGWSNVSVPCDCLLCCDYEDLSILWWHLSIHACTCTIALDSPAPKQHPSLSMAWNALWSTSKQSQGSPGINWMTQLDVARFGSYLQLVISAYLDASFCNEVLLHTSPTIWLIWFKFELVCTD